MFIDTSHSINWINISCWLFEYVINICNFLVWIVEFILINIIIILIVISIILMVLYQINNTSFVVFPHVHVNIVVCIVVSYDTISFWLINLILYY